MVTEKRVWNSLQATLVLVLPYGTGSVNNKNVIHKSACDCEMMLPGVVPLSAPVEQDRLERCEDIGKHKHNGKQVFSESTVGQFLFTPGAVTRFANEHA